MGAMHPILDGEDDDWQVFPDEPVTICVDCDNVHPDTRGKPPFSWRCMAFPAAPLGGFVDPDYRPDPPYHKCEKINRGACEFWTPRRTPKEATDDRG
ncbi:XRE family transcriptional regulator [Pseudanabaena phage Pam5]|nr:XRE family transcriptional regulator [Pseudanabaena phage Pam5]